METSDVVLKSALKKSNILILNKSKKVTFCNIVKVLLDEPSVDSKINEENLPIKWVEISILDDSNESLRSPLEAASNDDCNVTDFLVHKVIYDNYVIPDDDGDSLVQPEETEDGLILFESQLEEEDLEFVVHKVTDHEDDLIKKESDFETAVSNNREDASTPGSECNSVCVQEFSELSIENILEHDKIIAFIDQKEFYFSPSNQIEVSVSDNESNETNEQILSLKKSLSGKNASELVLSPPLQELSLEKIVKAHSDNILYELDISPLNSIQETDSDSDVSSEGTMIMMTSEECQRNEQHIRESFKQYQTMKEKADKVEELKLVTSPPKDPIACVSQDKNIGMNHECMQEKKEINIPKSKTDSTLERTTCVSSSFDVKRPGSFTSEIETLNAEFCTNELQYPKKARSSSVPDNNVLYSSNMGTGLKYFNSIRRVSLSTPNDARYQDKSLASVEIPQDVREWKILLSSLDKNDQSFELQKCRNVQSKGESCMAEKVFYVQNSKLDTLSNSPPKLSSLPVQNTDELEHFVNESTERVERIRKRYLLRPKQEMKLDFRRHSQINHARPRFGSTAEILQLIQKQNQPPFITFEGTKNHMSWPCNETMSNTDIRTFVKSKNHSSNLYVSQNLSGGQISINTYSEDQSNSNTCDHYSISSCPSIMMHERGIPEGASPPRSLTENCIEEPYTDENSDSFVYYSMKV